MATPLPLRRPAPRLAAALLALLAAVPWAHGRAEGEALALKVKASYVYNLLRFVHWPEGALEAETFRLCVIGDDPLAGVIERLHGRKVRGRTIQVERDGEADACPLTYVARSEAPRLDALLARLARPGVLTVGDLERFARRGGVVGFAPAGERVAIRISPAHARRAGLEISSKLLEIAELVGENESRGGERPLLVGDLPDHHGGAG